VRVASEVGNLHSKFGHARSLVSRIIHYVRDGPKDGQTDGQTDGRTKATLIATFPTVGGIIIIAVVLNLIRAKCLLILLWC